MVDQRSTEPHEGRSGPLSSMARSIMEGIIPALAARAKNRPPKLVEELTFRDVIEYFAIHHPGDLSVRSGALIRMPHPRGHNITQVFLGPNDELVLDDEGQPYGRQLIAMRLDAELAYRFESTDTLIFR